jgi:hypothetical protein
MASPDSLRFIEPSTGDLRPVVTDELVRTVETLLGHKLPDAYIALMKRHNGGYIRQHDIAYQGPIPENLRYYLGDCQIAIGSINGIDVNDKCPVTLGKNAYMIKEWGLPPEFVLLDGDGHTWIALDYRQAPMNPPVVFYVTDEEQFVTIAPDFASFIDRLVPHVRQPGPTSSEGAT